MNQRTHARTHERTSRTDGLMDVERKIGSYTFVYRWVKEGMKTENRATKMAKWADGRIEREISII